MDGIHLSQNRDKFRVFVNTTLNLSIVTWVVEAVLGNDSVNTLKRATIEAVSQRTNVYYSLLGNSQLWLGIT
jgi:spore maturation protein SpmA